MNQTNPRLKQISICDGELFYFPGFLAPTEADNLFRALREQIEWEQHVIKVFGRKIPCPRLSAWYGDEDAVYTYSGLKLPPRGWIPALAEIRDRVEEQVAAPFNSVLANFYRDGNDSMGWHSDNEPELGHEPIISSVSLGGIRRFVLKHRRKKRRSVPLLLEPGSLLVMSGKTQNYWRHAVPKTKKAVNARINLTFRLIHPRK